MTLREVLSALAALADRVGLDAEVTVYCVAGYGQSGVDGVFRDKAGEVGIAADNGHRSAREMHEHPDDREKTELPS